MFKTLVILFISIAFLLLAYKILMGMQQPRSAKPTSPVAKSKKESSQQKTNLQKQPNHKDKPSEFHTTLLPEIINSTIEKMTKVSPTEASLAEKIEAIGGKIGDPVYLRIFKEEEELEMWMWADGKYHHIQTYPICAYSGDLGPKLKEGDKQSPEGFYYVTKSRLNPNSRFHLSFNLGYPNRYDRVHGRTGSFLMVHGECVSIGCYAMTNSKIEEIYELVEQALSHGQKIVRVHAFPFRMSRRKMLRYQSHKWIKFWENLKEGYDWFEEKKIPPNVTVKQRRYTFD